MKIPLILQANSSSILANVYLPVGNWVIRKKCNSDIELCESDNPSVSYVVVDGLRILGDRCYKLIIKDGKNVSIHAELE